MEQALHPNAIQPMQQFALSTGKNASDMAMVVDAMDLLHSGRFDAFAIVSSDADFTPLAMRLRAQNMRVFGFGEKKTPEPFVNACSTFLFIDEQPVDAKSSQRGGRTARTAADSETAPGHQAGEPAPRCGGSGKGRRRLVEPGRGRAQHRQSRLLRPAHYGYAKLSALIEATELFETRREALHVQVRAKPKKATKPQAGQKPG